MIVTSREPDAVSRPPAQQKPREFVPTDSPVSGTFQALVQLLDASSRSLIGSAQPHLLVIPVHDEFGKVSGGFWGATMFEWMHVGLLFVPEALRLQGIGSALMAAAEAEAQKRGCRGAYVDTFSFQAGPFYQKLGYKLFGTLDDYPPGHSQLYFCKRFKPRPMSGPDADHTNA